MRRALLGAQVAGGLALLASATTGHAAPSAAPASAVHHLRTYAARSTVVTSPLTAARPDHSRHHQTKKVDLGPAPKNAHVSATVYLGLRHRKEAWELLRHVSTPGDPLYHQYISAAEFHRRFSPTDAQMAQLRRYFEKSGIRVGPAPANNHSVQISGTVGAMEKALRVRFDRFGSLFDQAPPATIAAVGPPNLPEPIRAMVSNIAGISHSERATPTHVVMGKPHRVAPKAGPPSAYRDAQPCSSWWGQNLATWAPPLDGQTVPDVPCGYVPSQFQSAYGIDSVLASGNTGQGQTVAIVDAFASPTIKNDANYYALQHGQPEFAPGQFREIMMKRNLRKVPASNIYGPQDWAIEESLDVEAVHTMAPGANVLYVGAKAPTDDALQAALNRIIDGQLANVISNSWGEGEPAQASDARPWNDLFVQAGLEGISVLFASGDSGAGWASGYGGGASVGWPASSPGVTGVGGTSLGIGQDGSKLWETGWGTQQSSLTNGAWGDASFSYGAGGGVSWLYGVPWYQQGVVPTALATQGVNGGPHRTVPDIAMPADPVTGMLMGMTMAYPDGEVGYGEFRIGGTSEATPLLAGVIALSNNATGFEHGFLNPAIYRLYGSPYLNDMVAPGPSLAAVETSYDDGYSGSKSVYLDYFGQDLGLALAPGYDEVTGVGAPAPGFITELGIG